MNKKVTIWNLFSILILAFFALFILYPLFLILYKSVIAGDTGAFSLQYFAHFFAKRFYWGTMVNSLKVTVVSTFLAAALGLPMAYLMGRLKIRGSSFLNILIVISYLSPPFIGAYAWIQLLGRNGVITHFLNSTFGFHFGGVYGFAGIVLVFTLQSFPLVFIYVSGALKSLDNSLNEAAESLGYSQSAVTVQIKALEEELGVRLFDRMGKRVILTAQGQCFLEYANSVLDTIHNARRALSEDAELEGCLHIGTLESLCFFRLPGLMHQFRLEHPKVSLRVTTGSPEELIEKMERGQVDLICILDEPRYSNSWHKCNEIPEEVVFAASPDIDLGHPGPYRVAELLDKPFFLTERNANYRRTFDRFLASRQIELTPSLEISDTSFIIKMLERSSGISLLPRFAVAELASRGDLRILEVSDFRLTMYRQMFYHKDKCCTREMDAFIQLASGPDLPLL